MPSIEAVRDATEKVIIERGPIKIEMDCYLEKIGANNDEYAAMQRAESSIRNEFFRTGSRLALFANPTWISQQLQEEVPVKDGEPRLPTDKEMDKRSKAMIQQMEQANADLKRLDADLLTNKCQRIAYLTKAWDLTHQVDGADVMLPVTVENMTANLSSAMIDAMLNAIEGAVFGPLATGPNTSS